MDPDYVAGKYNANKLLRKKTACKIDFFQGASPFALKDVTSKSAMMNMGDGDKHMYWMNRNPNAVGRKTGNRKKKNRN